MKTPLGFLLSVVFIFTASCSETSTDTAPRESVSVTISDWIAELDSSTLDSIVTDYHDYSDIHPSYEELFYADSLRQAEYAAAPPTPVEQLNQTLIKQLATLEKYIEKYDSLCVALTVQNSKLKQVLGDNEIELQDLKTPDTLWHVMATDTGSHIPGEEDTLGYFIEDKFISTK